MGNRKPFRLFVFLSSFFSILCLITSVILIYIFVSEQSKPRQIDYNSNSTKRVLFLRSYHPLYFTNAAHDKGLSESLIKAGIEYDVFYMDAKSYNKPEDIASFHDFLKERIEKHVKYDAILLADDPALKFALTYQDELFKDLPMVFFGVNNLALAEKAAIKNKITGFYENQYLTELISIAMQLFPKAKTIVAIHDNSEAGNADWDFFIRLKMTNPAYNFMNIDSSQLSQEEFISAIESIPNDAIVFYMTCYVDKYGNVYSMRSRTDLVLGSTQAPVFRNYVGGESQGILGSYYMDFEKQAYMAGITLAEVLSGNDIAAYPLVYETPGVCTFDWRLMKKYGLDFSKLPKSAKIYNRPFESLREHKLLLLAGLIAIIGLIVLAISSYIAQLFTKNVNNELITSRNNLLKAEEEMRYQVEYDEVLDIFNRRTITERISESIANKENYSIIIIDIDGFKALNENYGHAVADSVLQYLVAVLKGLATDGNWMIGRFGGDEFIIFVPDEKLTLDHQIIKKMLQEIRSPIPLGDETLAITASIGISTSDGITQIEQHISNAETAMYEAKNHGRNGAALYDDEMKAKDREEKEIKEKLEKAFVNEEEAFFMVYQPQINSKTKKVSGYEALIRMKEPGMFPGKFIPVAEHNGWIWRIGRITTELVIKQIANWRDEGYELHPVSINFSSNQLNDHGYIDYMQGLLNKYDVPANLIEIEITEGVFLEKSALADDIFKRFKKMGIKLLMDDFGTGYSSLGYLTYIPVDVIKLDKSLVDTYLVDGKDSFIKNIIRLMHDLNKEMIIEGVEEEWQFERLKKFGADTIQGYFFSKPIPADEAINFKVS